MSLSKSNQKYWEQRLKNRSFTRSGGEKYQSPEFSVRISVGGKPEWFNLDSANKAVAASKARDIWLFAQSHTPDEVLKEYKKKSQSSKAKTGESPTVGDLLKEIEELNLIKTRTFHNYARMLRRVVTGTINIKSDASKYDHVHKGNQKWRQKVEAVKIADLTPEKIMKWRASYLKAASSDPLARETAMTTVTSTIRNAKALFNEKYTKHLSFPLPHNPFEGITTGHSVTRKYRGNVDFKSLAKVAQEELHMTAPTYQGDDSKAKRRAQQEVEDRNQQFKILLLGLGCGLRRREIDVLLWENLDFEENTISVLTTEYGSTKTATSERTIDVAPSIMKMLSQYQETEGEDFVIQSNVDPNPNATYGHYRCNRHFKHLITWLRKHGVTRSNAIHEMRKEYGSRVCQEFGIYAASTALGHGSIATTAASYLDKKEKVFVEL